MERGQKEITDAKRNKMDGNAIANLHLTLANAVLSSLEEKKTVKEIWGALTKLYKAKSLYNKIFLKKEIIYFSCVRIRFSNKAR